MLDEERIKLYLIEAIQKLQLTPYQTKSRREHASRWAERVKKLLESE